MRLTSDVAYSLIGLGLCGTAAVGLAPILGATPLVAAGSAIAGFAGSLSIELAGSLCNRFTSWLAERSRPPGEAAQNHDLERLLSNAIATCLRACADDLDGDANAQRRIRAWAKEAAGGIAYAHQDTRFSELSIENIDQYLHITDDSGYPRILTPELWRTFLGERSYDDRDGSNRDALELASQFLFERLSSFLIGTYRESLSNDPRAYVALQQLLLHSLRDEIMRVSRDTRSLQSQMKHALSEISTISAAILGKYPAETEELRILGYTIEHLSREARHNIHELLSVSIRAEQHQIDNSATLKKIHEALVRNAPDASASMRTMVVADCQLVVIRAILQAWNLDAQLSRRGWSVQYRWRPWSDALLAELAEGVLDFAIYNTERTSRYIESDPHAPIVHVQDFGHSMGGNHFYVLARRGLDVDASSIQRFKSSIRGGLIVVPHDSDIYENLAVVGLTTEELDRLGVRTLHFDAHNGLRVFDTFPDALLVAGQNPRIQGLFRREFEEIVNSHCLDRSEQMILRARSANSLVIGKLPIELLGRRDAEALGRVLRQEFFTGWTLDFDGNMRTLEAYFSHTCDSRAECNFMLRRILFHTYRFGPPPEVDA